MSEGGIAKFTTKAWLLRLYLLVSLLATAFFGEAVLLNILDDSDSISIEDSVGVASNLDPYFFGPVSSAVGSLWSAPNPVIRLVARIGLVATGVAITPVVLFLTFWLLAVPVVFSLLLVIVLWLLARETRDPEA